MGFIADRMGRIGVSQTLAASQKAGELKVAGHNVISLTAGEPDFATPEHVVEAAARAAREGQTKYTPVNGTPELKVAIATKLRSENRLVYAPAKQIIVGTGGKQVLFNALMATINAGDEVIIPSPYWVSYPDMTQLFGGKPVFVEGNPENGFKITPDQLEAAITDKTKWLILNSPSNPTGGAYSKEELAALGEVLKRHPHVHIMSDDIYEHITYDGFEFHTIAAVVPELADRTLTVNGVSKAYAMTGWRIGYGAGPEELVKAMTKLQSQSTSNPSSISQAAALAALTGPQEHLQTNAEAFQRRRDLVVAGLNAIDGITCNTPEGAFYVLPDCRGLNGRRTEGGKTIGEDIDMTTYLLEDGLVATVPGAAFGAEGFVRISYATSDRLLETAIERIAASCQKLNGRDQGMTPGKAGGGMAR